MRGFAARLTAGESAMLSRYTGESATGATSMVSLKSAAASIDPRCAKLAQQPAPSRSQPPPSPACSPPATLLTLPGRNAPPMPGVEFALALQ